MTELLMRILSGLAGAGLGVVFFGGLWWTVCRAFASQNPALLFLCSILIRTTIALVGFYFVADGQWHRLLACLVGFLTARFLITWLTKPAGKIRDIQRRETPYMP